MAPDSDQPSSPSTSFYAMSDEEEGYDTITHARSVRGVKLLYCKNKVRKLPPSNPVLSLMVAKSNANPLLSHRSMSILRLRQRTIYRVTLRSCSKRTLPPDLLHQPNQNH